jgi:hypothetical protein
MAYPFLGAPTAGAAAAGDVAAAGLGRGARAGRRVGHADHPPGDPVLVPAVAGVAVEAHHREPAQAREELAGGDAAPVGPIARTLLRLLEQRDLHVFGELREALPVLPARRGVEAAEAGTEEAELLLLPRRELAVDEGDDAGLRRTGVLVGRDDAVARRRERRRLGGGQDPPAAVGLAARHGAGGGRDGPRLQEASAVYGVGVVHLRNLRRSPRPYRPNRPHGNGPDAPCRGSEAWASPDRLRVDRARARRGSSARGSL